uniref:Uncharacterized protein n=1 Tax=Physcomitrium patens TaxID=3218 RepID=A0A2K1IY17_PHYPA|nr:hypothetical protein PHYPA_023997 [Physcomitrium patens]
MEKVYAAFYLNGFLFIQHLTEDGDAMQALKRKNS